jgi:hypothetical protein
MGNSILRFVSIVQATGSHLATSKSCHLVQIIRQDSSFETDVDSLTSERSSDDTGIGGATTRVLFGGGLDDGCRTDVTLSWENINVYAADNGGTAQAGDTARRACSKHIVKDGNTHDCFRLASGPAKDTSSKFTSTILRTGTTHHKSNVRRKLVTYNSLISVVTVLLTLDNG